jgi:hypothetical protein
MTKIAGSDPNPDPLVRGMDPRIRIHAKMSWIRNTGSSFPYRGLANGIFSWGVYYGYGLAFVFGIYITQV